MTQNSTRTITIGGSGITQKLTIGGSSPVRIQTMWKEGIDSVLTDTQCLFSVLKNIETLQSIGCEVLRFAVPTAQSAKALCLIAEQTTMPLVADIHFDYTLALACLKGNIAKIRINPGNIGSKEKTAIVVNACKEKGVAIRIGVNAGSFPKDIEQDVLNGNMSRATGLAKTAEREIEVFSELDFQNYIVSMKASSIQETIDANETFYTMHPSVPLHVGVTEAGPLIGGIVKSTVAFTHLLSRGIGSTIRVSLSSSAENEIIAAREILSACGLLKTGVNIVSCPRCGRNGFDVHAFVDRWQTKLMALNKNITVAVMGCSVNGPGEAKHADIGITGSSTSCVIFKKGKVVKTIKNDDVNLLIENADNAFIEELNNL